MGCSQSKSAAAVVEGEAKSRQQDEHAVLMLRRPEGPKEIETTKIFTNDSTCTSSNNNAHQSTVATNEFNNEKQEEQEEEDAKNNTNNSDPTEEEKEEEKKETVVVTAAAVADVQIQGAEDNGNGVPSLNIISTATESSDTIIKVEGSSIESAEAAPAVVNVVVEATNAKSAVEVNNEGGEVVVVAKPAADGGVVVDNSPAAAAEETAVATTASEENSKVPPLQPTETIRPEEETRTTISTVVSNQQKKVKPSFKHHQNAAAPAVAKIMPNVTTSKDEFLKPNNNINVKNLVLGVNDKTVRTGVLVIDDVDDDNVANNNNNNQRKKSSHYGTPFDFDLPAVVADMEARERDRKQIAMKKGTPAIKINQFVRVAVVSIVVEAVSSSSSRSYSSQ